MKVALNLDALRKALKDKDISIYKLAKLCGVNHSTLYTYFTKDIPVSEKTCKIIADAIEMPVNEVFPEFVERNDVSAGEESVDEPKTTTIDGTTNNKNQIMVADMMVGSQTMAPADGKTLFVRKIMNCDGHEFPGYTLHPNEQIIIKTGVSSERFDMSRVMVRIKPDKALKHELTLNPFPYARDKEICIVMYSYGKPHLLSKGQEVAELVFLDKE